MAAATYKCYFGLVRQVGQVLSSTKWGNGVGRLLDQERGGRIGKARSTGDAVLYLECLPLSSLLFSLSSFSLKATCGQVLLSFTSGFPFRFGFTLGFEYNVCFLAMSSRREELVHEISVLHTIYMYVLGRRERVSS